MGNKGTEITIKINGETDDTIKDIKSLTKEVDRLGKELEKTGKSSKGMNSLAKGFKSLGTSLKGLVAGYTALRIATSAIDFSKLAGDAERASESFNTIFESMGLDAEKEFNKIKEAAKGLIPEAAIKQSAVTAASLGVPIEKLAELMEIARVKARVMGTDVKSAFNDLAVGIGRGSPMILDNLGLTIKLEDANTEYAESIGKTAKELTKQEKQLALTNAVIRAAATDMERFGTASLSASEESQKMTTQIEELKVKIGQELLPHMLKLTEATSDYVGGMNKADFSTFGKSVDLLVTSLGLMLKAIVALDDYGMPDWLIGGGEKEVGAFGVVIERLSKSMGTLKIAIDKLSSVEDDLFTSGEKYKTLKKNVDNFTGTSKDFYTLKDAIKKAIAADEELMKGWANSSAPSAYRKELTEVGGHLNGLYVAMEELEKIKPFEPSIKSAKELSDAVEKASKSVLKYSEEEIKALNKLGKDRVKESQSTTKKLLSNEKKLVNDIVKINETLANKLKDIEKDRWQTDFDITEQIEEQSRVGLSLAQEYAAKEKTEAQALADAKDAIKKGELDKAKTYLDKYQKYALESAGNIEKYGSKIALSEKAAADAKIGVLNQVQTLENAIYDEKAKKAQVEHDTAIKTAQLQLQGIKAQLEGQKALYEAAHKLAQLTNKDLGAFDATSINNAIAKMGELIVQAETLKTTPTSLIIDTTSIDEAKVKTEELKTLTINGITLEVGADTTPADFGIKKMISTAEGETIVIGVNPEYEKAEKEIEQKVKPAPVELAVDADTKKADGKVQKLKIKITDPSTQTVNADTTAANAAIDKLKQPTSSVHTVYINQIVTTSGGGGGGGTPVNTVANMSAGSMAVSKMSGMGSASTATMSATPSGQISNDLGELGTLRLAVGDKEFPALVPKEVADALQTYINTEGGL